MALYERRRGHQKDPLVEHSITPFTSGKLLAILEPFPVLNPSGYILEYLAVVVTSIAPLSSAYAANEERHCVTRQTDHGLKTIDCSSPPRSYSIAVIEQARFSGIWYATMSVFHYKRCVVLFPLCSKIEKYPVNVRLYDRFICWMKHPVCKVVQTYLRLCAFFPRSLLRQICRPIADFCLVKIGIVNQSKQDLDRSSLYRTGRRVLQNKITSEPAVEQLQDVKMFNALQHPSMTRRTSVSSSVSTSERLILP